MTTEESGKLETIMHRGRAGTTHTIVAIPPAGTGPQFYQTWVSAPDRESNLLVVQLPGRGTRMFDRPVDSIEGAAESIAEYIADLERGPGHSLTLFGHSMGAWIAYETTRNLLRRNERMVRALAISACPPPGIQIDAATGLDKLSDDEFLDIVQERFGPIPEIMSASAGVRRLMIPTMRNDLRLCANYSPRDIEPRGLPIPIWLLSGTSDTVVSAEAVKSWSTITTATCQQREFPGGHMFVKEHAQEVLSIIDHAPR